MNNLFVVFETNGEDDSDYSDWPIAVFDSKEKADAFAAYKNQQKEERLEQWRAERRAYTLELANELEQAGNPFLFTPARSEITMRVRNKYKHLWQGHTWHDFFVYEEAVPVNPDIELTASANIITELAL